MFRGDATVNRFEDLVACCKAHLRHRRTQPPAELRKPLMRLAEGYHVVVLQAFMAVHTPDYRHRGFVSAVLRLPALSLWPFCQYLRTCHGHLAYQVISMATSDVVAAHQAHCVLEERRGDNEQTWVPISEPVWPPWRGTRQETGPQSVTHLGHLWLPELEALEPSPYNPATDPDVVLVRLADGQFGMEATTCLRFLEEALHRTRSCPCQLCKTGMYRYYNHLYRWPQRT